MHMLDFDFSNTLAMGLLWEDTQSMSYHLERLHYMLKMFMVLHQSGEYPLYSVPVIMVEHVLKYTLMKPLNLMSMGTLRRYACVQNTMVVNPVK